MSRLGETQAHVLIRELGGFEREVALFPDDESVWRAPAGMTNSAGNLALHVAGNLQHFVGAILGGTGYVRDREREFSRRSGPRSEILAELEAARRAVRGVLPSLAEDRLYGEYPARVDGLTLRTDRFLVHLCAHAGYHLGQASTVRRIVTGDARSGRPVPLAELTE